MPSTLLEQQNFFRTSLNQEIVDATDVIIYLKTLPTKAKGYLVIEQDNTSKREIIYYTSFGTGCVVLDDVSGRGIGGTVAQSHLDNADVVMDDVAEYHNSIATLLSNYRSGGGLSITGETDNISAAAGNIVINGAVCINDMSVTLSDIGVAGTDREGNVASGGYRYIYAQNVGDGTWGLYVSNNAVENGKRKIGLAKFKEGSTTIIRYVYDDDDYSPLARGIVLEWNGPLTDIPIGFALCNGVTAGTPNCSDKFVITAGTTYAFGATGGYAAITLATSQVPAHAHSGNTGYTDVNHNHSDSGHTHSGWTDAQGAHSHEYRSGDGSTSSGYAANTNMDQSRQNTESAGNHSHNVGMSSGYANISYSTINHSHSFSTSNVGGGASHDNMPPYIALVRIMKL